MKSARPSVGPKGGPGGTPKAGGVAPGIKGKSNIKPRPSGSMKGVGKPTAKLGRG